jgi:hypothetical protein
VWGSNMFSQAFGDSFAVTPKAKMYDYISFSSQRKTCWKILNNQMHAS